MTPIVSIMLLLEKEKKKIKLQRSKTLVVKQMHKTKIKLQRSVTLVVKKNGKEIELQRSDMLAATLDAKNHLHFFSKHATYSL